MSFALTLKSICLMLYDVTNYNDVTSASSSYN